jgi:UDP-glucose 4-epimerase
VKILVTGGAGFIGSHIVDAYIEAGHEVIVVDNLWEHGGGKQANVNRQARFVQMDIRDATFADLIRTERPEVINHHAAQASVKVSTDDPALDADVNILGLINLLQAAVEAGTRKVIFASSGATYGTVEHLPINEQTPQRPESPYGITKYASEFYLKYAKKERGLDFTAFRYGNVYGPRQDPHGEAGVVAIFTERVLGNQPCRIDWTGEQAKDYVFVGDVARASLMALDKGGGECICIATGTPTSVNRLLELISQNVGHTVPTTSAPRRPGDVFMSYFDLSYAKQVLGWEPTRTIEQGIAETVAWFRAQHDAAQ